MKKPYISLVSQEFYSLPSAMHSKKKNKIDKSHITARGQLVGDA